MSSHVTPEAFAAPQPPSRIIGTETECQVRWKNGGVVDHWQSFLLSQKVLEAQGLEAFYIKDNDSNHVRGAWLDNGMFLYPDVGHLEVCSAEHLGPRQATAGTHAGVRMLNNLCRAADNPFLIHRRAATVGNNGKIVTQGYHVNFLTAADTLTDPLLTDLLSSHWATQVYASGGIVTTLGYNIMPKSIGVGQVVGTSISHRTNEKHKLMGILRGPEGDKEVNSAVFGFGRIEDRSKAPGNKWSDFMGMATTSALVRAIELKQIAPGPYRALGELVLQDPVYSFHQASWDINMQVKHPTINGKHYTAPELQAKYAEEIAEMAQDLDFPQDEQFGIEEWIAVCDTLMEVGRGETDITAAKGRMDSANKYYDMQRQFGEDVFLAGPIEARRRCLTWDRVAPAGRGQLFDERCGRQVVEPEEIALAEWEAPHTRASIRARRIRNQKEDKVYHMGWSSIGIYGTAKPDVLHPYAS